MMHVPLQCFERKSFHLQSDLQERQGKKQTEKRKNILCRLCGEIITSENNRVTINGSNVHTFQNPAGITFTFACFDAAPGCRMWGKSTIEHTWFSGYFWQIAVCAGCGEHLGWSFKNSIRFYGLIVERLADSDT